MRKSLGTCVLLLGLLLGTSAIANADTISFTSVDVRNLQIVPTTGTVVFSTPQTGSPTTASGAAANSLDEEAGSSSQTTPIAQAAVSITFATASGVSVFTNPSVAANGTVILPGCVCSAETEGLATLRASFMITGGTGNVDVTVSALLQTIQNLETPEFDSFAASETRFTLQVGAESFSFDSRLRIGPDEATRLETQRLISQLFTLQFNQQYDLRLFVGANSRAGQTEIPEPATVFLLMSGLGAMTGIVKKRRAMNLK